MRSLYVALGISISMILLTLAMDSAMHTFRADAVTDQLANQLNINKVDMYAMLSNAFLQIRTREMIFHCIPHVIISITILVGIMQYRSKQ